MTRKDYIALASALAGAQIEYRDRDEGQAALRFASHLIADVLQADNERFDRERFLIAAGFRQARIPA